MNRYVLTFPYKNVQVYGFCDAISLAYGAGIYIFSQNENGKRISNLLCAKTRVAPLKMLSIPRLELRSALLLAKLVRDTTQTINFNKIYLWSDYTIVMAWINSESRLFHTFVAIRISQIQNLTEP